MLGLRARESFHRYCGVVFSVFLLPVAPFHYAIDGWFLSGARDGSLWERGEENRGPYSSFLMYRGPYS